MTSIPPEVNSPPPDDSQEWYSLETTQSMVLLSMVTGVKRNGSKYDRYHVEDMGNLLSILLLKPRGTKVAKLYNCTLPLGQEFKHTYSAVFKYTDTPSYHYNPELLLLWAGEDKYAIQGFVYVRERWCQHRHRVSYSRGVPAHPQDIRSITIIDPARLPRATY